MHEKKVSTADEFFFLPPLKMMLSAPETETRERPPVKALEPKPVLNRENVEKLIKKLTETDD